MKPAADTACREPAAGLPVKNLTRKNVYILPTRYGFMFLFILVVILLDSMNHNNNLEFLYTFLLAGVFLVSVFHTYRNLRGLELMSARADPVFAGEKALFELRVRASFRDRSALRFSFHREDQVLADLPGRKESRILIPVATQKRGVLDPGKLSIFTFFPLGIFRSWSIVDTQAKCLVYPRPLPGPFILREEKAGSEPDGKTPGPGAEDFKGLRAFQPGDSLQHIYWKAFSGAKGLLTKEFAGQTGGCVTLNWEALNGPEVEVKLSCLCQMVLTAHEQNLAYGLKLPGVFLGPSRGEAHKHQCLKALALFGLSEPEPRVS